MARVEIPKIRQAADIRKWAKVRFVFLVHFGTLLGTSFGEVKFFEFFDER